MNSLEDMEDIGKRIKLREELDLDTSVVVFAKTRDRADRDVAIWSFWTSGEGHYSEGRVLN